MFVPKFVENLYNVSTSATPTTTTTATIRSNNSWRQQHWPRFNSVHTLRQGKQFQFACRGSPQHEYKLTHWHQWMSKVQSCKQVCSKWGWELLWDLPKSELWPSGILLTIPNLNYVTCFSHKIIRSLF